MTSRADSMMSRATHRRVAKEDGASVVSQSHKTTSQAPKGSNQNRAGKFLLRTAAFKKDMPQVSTTPQVLGRRQGLSPICPSRLFPASRDG